MTPATAVRARGRRVSGWRFGAATVLLASLLAATVGCASSSPTSTAPAARPAQPVGDRPNIVFVLTDDLSNNLVQYMPHVQAMQRSGMTFTNYTVTDSLCCPSRSSILTGNYPHNTGVFTNSPPWGGYAQFHGRGEEKSTFAVALHKAGYQTAFMGKYLNGYQPASAKRRGDPTPEGWDEWDGVGNGYNEYNYNIAHNGTSKFYGHRPQDYLTTVLQQRADGFISSAAASGKPFLLELATFTPHTPYVPAPADVKKFPGLTAPRGASFNVLPTHPPAWLAGHRPLTATGIRNVDARYRLRARDVLSIDRLLASIQQAGASAGASRNTIVVFSSDNGYHLGEHGLKAGKLTAFETDVNVPLVVSGPQVPAGSVNRSAVQNIDLAPTFEALAGLKPGAQIDGSSFADLLHGRPGNRWPAATLVEHHGPDTDVHDPDYPGPQGANPPSYQALRTASFTYVEYATGDDEYYDRRRDPEELHNIVGRLSPARLAELRQELLALTSCHGSRECTAARNVRP